LLPVITDEPLEERLHEPLRWQRNLHVEFADLPLAGNGESLEILAAFASRWGTLGLTEGASDVVQRQAADLPPEGPVYRAEHLIAWGRAISRVRGLLELVQACKREEVELLRKYVRWHSRPLGVQLIYTWPGTREAATYLLAQEEPPIAAERLHTWSASPCDVDRYVAPVEYWLYRELNSSLRDHTALFVSKEGGGRVRVESLLGGFYVMLAEQLAGLWEMNRCVSCGRLFLPSSRSDQKTCSSLCRKRLSRRNARGEKR
jgi:hypothetical protein